MQLAFSNPQNSCIVDIWARYLYTDKDGGIKFWVINGAWKGTFRDDNIFIGGIFDPREASLVWFGEDLEFFESDYNEAIKELEVIVDDFAVDMTKFEHRSKWEYRYQDEDVEYDVPF